MAGADLLWFYVVSSRTPSFAVGNPPPRQGLHRLRTVFRSGCQPLSSRQGLRRFVSRFSLSVTHCSQGTDDEKRHSRISILVDWSPLIRLGSAYAAPIRSSAPAPVADVAMEGLFQNGRGLSSLLCTLEVHPQPVVGRARGPGVRL